MAYSYWMSFVGNVLGAAGTDEWMGRTKPRFADGKPGIWMLGWDAVRPYPTDAQVSATTLRHGNFDYLTNTVKWDPAIADRALPNSLYLTRKPAFFDAGRGYIGRGSIRLAQPSSTRCRPRRATMPGLRSRSREFQNRSMQCACRGYDSDRADRNYAVEVPLILTT